MAETQARAAVAAEEGRQRAALVVRLHCVHAELAGRAALCVAQTHGRDRIAVWENSEQHRWLLKTAERVVWKMLMDGHATVTLHMAQEGAQQRRLRSLALADAEAELRGQLVEEQHKLMAQVFGRHEEVRRAEALRAEGAQFLMLGLADAQAREVATRRAVWLEYADSWALTSASPTALLLPLGFTPTGHALGLVPSHSPTSRPHLLHPSDSKALTPSPKQEQT